MRLVRDSYELFGQEFIEDVWNRLLWSSIYWDLIKQYKVSLSQIPPEDAGGLTREYVLRIPSVS